MIEQDLIDLGFNRTDVSAEESGANAFYYYVLDPVPGFGLISCASDEKTIVTGHYRWYVEIFEADSVRFVERKDLEEFINIIKKKYKMKEDLNKNEFDYQGRTKKQYGDSAKIVLIAALGLFTLMTFSALYNLILG